jgi:hypothetical protein
MSERGVIYMVWGEKPERYLQRSMASVRAHHPELPIHVERIAEDTSDPSGMRNLLHKARMLDVTPFKSTLFLDVDTVVLGRLDYAFAKAERFGLACAICECPWARRYRGVHGDTVEYNTGVLFFTAAAQPVFDAWKRLSSTLDSSFSFYYGPDRKIGTMPYNDQPSFAQAIEETGFQPHVLPLNWNLRPQWQKTFFGPIRIWHSYTDVPAGLIELNRAYERPEALIDFHDAGVARAG